MRGDCECVKRGEGEGEGWCVKDERGREEGGVRQFTCEGEWTNEVIAITTTASLLLYV